MRRVKASNIQKVEVVDSDDDSIEDYTSHRVVNSIRCGNYTIISEGLKTVLVRVEDSGEEFEAFVHLHKSQHELKRAENKSVEEIIQW